MLDSFLAKSPVEIRAELHGMPDTAVEAVLRFHAAPGTGTLEAMLPAMVAWHLSPRPQNLPDSLPPDHRLREDLGLDSLALAEMTFKLDELLGVPIETREVAGVRTVADLMSFLCGKLGLA
jgi:acyl carrier protein